MDTIEVFLQGVGIPRIALIKVPSNGRVRDIVEAAKAHGLRWTESREPQVWLENSDEPLDPELIFASAGVKARSRLHVHTCHRVKVTVNFQNASKSHPFAPATTIGVVKHWADDKFGLGEVDATEYALQLCNSTERPSEDTQLGALVSFPECDVCFDLVPKQRVEG